MVKRRGIVVERGLPRGAVDSLGGGVIDPTANVIALVEANAKTAEKLREADNAYSAAESAHLKEISELRATHAKETREFDSERYEKIRSVDQLNAAATAEQILQAVNTNLQAQERTAQTLRDQVATTATAAENRQNAFANDMLKRLGMVELSLSRGEGKQTVADPQMEKLTALVETLARNQDRDAGKQQVSDPVITQLLNEVKTLRGTTGAGLELGWKIIAGAAVLLSLYLGYQRSTAATPPQINYYLPGSPLPTTPQAPTR